MANASLDSLYNTTYLGTSAASPSLFHTHCNLVQANGLVHGQWPRNHSVGAVVRH